MSEHKLRISVKGIFKDANNRVLLVKLERNNQDFWSAPGGGVEENETVKDTLLRELREETGYSGEVGELIFVQDIRFSSGTRQLELFFEGTIDEQIDKKPEERYQFFTEEEFGDIEFMPKDLNPFSEHKKIPFFSEI
ncbi:MAG: NUDIX hydrolase [Candidatus Berkelbacteria bacterium]